MYIPLVYRWHPAHACAADFNEYCVIIDVDGNGWSDRFAQLVQFNTPVLKARSGREGGSGGGSRAAAQGWGDGASDSESEGRTVGHGHG